MTAPRPASRSIADPATRYAERVTPPVRYSTQFTSAISYTRTLRAYRRACQTAWGHHRPNLRR